MRHVIVVMLVATSALLLAGCGGGSSDGATASGAPAGGSGALPDAAPASGPGIDMMMGTGGGMPGDPGLPADAANLYGSAAPSATENGGLPGDAGLPGAGALPGDAAFAGMPGVNYPGGQDPNAAGVLPADGTQPYPPGAMPGYPEGAMPGVVPGATPEPKPTTLDGLAKYALKQGREKDALQYFYAWGLTSDAGAADVLASYQWVPALRRPAVAIRWGIGVHVTPASFNGDPKPIGTTQGLVVGKRREGGREGGAAGGAVPGGDAGAYASAAPGYGGMPGGDAAARSNSLTRFTGEFGEKVLQEFQNRVANGSFGKLYQDAAPTSASPATGDNPYGAAGIAYGAVPGALPGGEALPGGYPGAGAGGGAPPRSGSIAQVTPGLISVGQGTEKDLLDKARKEGVDVLAIVSVKITVNRANLVINESEVALYDVLKPAKWLYKSTELSNTKVELARQGNKEDGVDREVQELFEFIDKNLALTTLPDFPPDAVKSKRLPVLVQGKHENPVPVLAEIRFYNRNKLISDEDAKAALGQLIGSEAAAATLLEGSEEDRKKVLEKWLPRI